MPGPVIQGHAKYEQECKKCHTRFKKSQQRTLCLDCHKKVAGDIQNKGGFHGKNTSAKSLPCKQCHREHLGRKADIIQFDTETFNHGDSDFAIKGKHNQVQCKQCHKPNHKWRQAPHACIDCHKKDDIHKGNLGAKCHLCHNEKRWGQTAFDHDKTKFPLKGRHKKVDCESCHPGKRFKKTPKTCYACHSVDDKHHGLFDKKCKACHTPKDWKTLKFDHNKDTKYKLRGRHRKTTCTSCHKKNAYRVKLKKACYDCHQADDVHKKRFGIKCNRCHKEIGWRKDKFDHDRDTKFPLKGKHKNAVCADCHRGDIGTATRKSKHTKVRACMACHKAEDIHKGEQGKKCQRCHNATGWRNKVLFDHDTATFPLIGLHAVVPCESCHTQSRYEKTEHRCSGCHHNQDTHKGSLTPRCERCHNPNGWSFWQFDHKKQTDYPLEGGHIGLTCKACHKTPVKTEIELSTECTGCHSADDIHRGQYGNQCDRCHTVKDFKIIQLNR